MSIELHCHTMFSVDAFGTPEELVEVAAEHGVTALAVTEHNDLGSLERARAAAAGYGIRYYPGVELDAFWRGEQYHFIALGFDADNDALRAMVERHQAVYVDQFEKMLPHFEAVGYPLSRDGLLEGLADHYPTHPSPGLNRFYARRWALDAGVFPDDQIRREVFAEVIARTEAAHGAPLGEGFSSFAAMRDTVHHAGGVVLLAHVGKYFPKSNHDPEGAEQIGFIRELMDHGLDGFELYHHANADKPYFEQLCALAERLKCPVSGGSDCHDARVRKGSKRLGGCGAPESLIETLDAALATRRSAAAG